jgi:phenylacetate-CoA ligase
LEDLKRLPIVEKDEFRRTPPEERVSGEFDIKRLKVVRTGGSTGKPLTIFLTREEDDWRKAIYMRANIMCGQRPRDRWVAITAPHHFGDVTGLQRRFGLFAQTCLSVFDDFNKHIEFIRNFKPDILDGYSGALVLLAREVKKRGLYDIRPKVVFGNADLMDNTSRKILEDVFAAPYCDQFGCAEVDRTAWNCLEREKYHMDVDSVLFEFVDEDGEEVAVGESGQILYTSLFNFAMPLIRYSVGDLGKPSNEFCSCGVKLPLMEVIEGRKDSVIVLPDGRFLSPRVFTVAMSMFKFYSFIEQFRIVQKKPEFFEIYLKMGASDINYEVVKKELIDHFLKVLNLKEADVSFDVRFVDDIPFSQSGKLMAVVSEVTRAV